MVLANRGRRFVQEITAGIGYLCMRFLNFGFGFFPVVAEFLLVCHASLVFGELGLLDFKAVERGNIAAIRERGETGYAQVNTNASAALSTSSRSRHRLFHFPLGLDADVPLAAFAGNGNIAQFPQRLTAVAVAYPAQFGQENTAVPLVNLDLFGIRVAETVTATPAFETRKISAFGKEMLVSCN